MKEFHWSNWKYNRIYEGLEYHRMMSLNVILQAVRSQHSCWKKEWERDGGRDRGRKKEREREGGGEKEREGKEKAKTTYILRYNKKCWGFYIKECDKNYNRDVTKVVWNIREGMINLSWGKNEKLQGEGGTQLALEEATWLRIETFRFYQGCNICIKG